MEGAEFDALADDISHHGLREPITLYEQAILDGRNRYRACMKSGVPPRFVDWQPRPGESPTSFVLSRNLHRRHLNESQRAMVGARVEPLFAAEAAERQRANLKRGDEAPVTASVPERDQGEAREHAAAVVNVSPRSVQAAKAVVTKGSVELVHAVETGNVTVATAATLAALPAAEQREVLAKGDAEVARATRRLREQSARERPHNPRQALHALEQAFSATHSRWPLEESLAPIAAWLERKLAEVRAEEAARVRSA
jgi:hypothetical protein